MRPGVEYAILYLHVESELEKALGRKLNADELAGVEQYCESLMTPRKPPSRETSKMESKEETA